MGSIKNPVLVVANIVILLIFGVSVILAPGVFSQQSGWLTTENPELLGGVASEQSFGQTLSADRNIPCSKQEFTIRPARILPLPQTKTTVDRCVVATKYGNVSVDGLIQLNGTSIAGQLKYSNGSKSSILPIPESEDAIVISNSSNGSIVKLYKNISRSVSVKTSFDGSVEFILPTTPDKVLKDGAGNTRYVKADTISFSKNGKFMVVDSEHVANLRVSLLSFEITPFETPYTYHLGLNPSVHMAITDDGQFAVSSSKFGGFRVTDLSTCASVPPQINGPVKCSTKQLSSFLHGQLSGYKNVRQPKFINNNLVSFFTTQTLSDGSTSVGRYRIAPAGNKIESTDYLALGDSYSSGEGAYNYFAETDTSENKCHLSKDSYPYLIGQSLELNEYNSVACSGARTYHILSEIQYPNVPEPNTMGSLLPGYKKQIDYVEEKDPDVITVGIGGNDIGFGDILKSCIGIGTCYDSYEDREELTNLISSKLDTLNMLYDELRLGLGKRVYVVGYPKVALKDSECAINVRMDNDEIIFSSQLIDYLNLAIATAAEQTGVFYVDVSDAFNGHKLCETDSNNSAMNGLTLGNDKIANIGPIGNEGFHPNKLGHQLYRNKILEKTNNFTAQMPAPDPSAQLPTEDSGLEILNAPSSGREVRNTRSDQDMTNDTVIAGENTSISLDGIKHGLRANTDYQAEIHSDPISLGVATADQNGDISTEVTIPDSVNFGFHTIHIIGENIIGETIDIYKTVFVGVRASDYDGDGVNNENDSCLIDVDSGQDADNDGIDDICDDDIVTTKDDDTLSSEDVANPVSSTKSVTNYRPQADINDQHQEGIASQSFQQPETPSRSIKGIVRDITSAHQIPELTATTINTLKRPPLLFALKILMICATLGIVIKLQKLRKHA